MAEVTIVKKEPKTEENAVHDLSNDDDDICELEHLRKLFIGGLAHYTTEEGLKAYYGQWGKVVDVVVMRDGNTKRSRGFGFITYTKSSMVDKAQENRPHVIDGKNVEAKRALPRPERESRESNITVKKLFVGGLKDNHDEECLYEYFQQFGRVVSVKLLTDKNSGKRRGFAFIEFDDYDAVDKAILQKSHSIKFVLVDVKKSIYNLEKKDRSGLNGNAGNGLNNKHQGKQLGNTQNQSNGGGYRASVPQQQMMPPYPPAHQPAPPMNAPPPNYNYWGPPPAMPQQYYQQPPPPQMNTWSYPQGQNGWNAQQPPATPQWQAPNQWGCPPPVGPPQVPQAPQTAVAPPPRCPPIAVPPAAGNWNMPPAVAPVPGPPGATGSVPMPTQAPQQPPPAQQQQQPALAQQAAPPNFGSGYQQNYGGGPTKHNNMGLNRVNPYVVGQNNGGGYNINNGQAPTTSAYAGYNSAGISNVPGPVPKPIGGVNGVNGSNSNGSSNKTKNKYRR